MTINEIEALAKKIQKQCAEDGEPVSIEEAREMATFELKSRNITRNVSENGQEKIKKPKVRKVDKTKEHILKSIEVLLQDMGATDTELNNEVELSFAFETDNYSLRLVKHRAKKGA